MNSLYWIKTALARSRITGDPKRIQLYRNIRLRNLLRYANRHAPYYQRLFERSGIDPEDIQDVSDLHRLPVTSKTDLRSCPEDTISNEVDASTLRTKFTTGSTGEPFRIRRTYWESGVLNMILQRCFRVYGMRSRDTVAVISMHAQTNRTSGIPSIISFVMNRGMGTRIHLDCLADPEQLADQLMRIKPDVILSYAGILARVGDLISERNRSKWRPRFLLSGSETLTSLRRRQIEEGFGSRVYDYYAAFESGVIAWECPETGLYHVADDHIILELERDGRSVPAVDGERGETIITNLHTFSMPFIRYRLNDTVVCGPSRCPCGAPFSTLRAIEGRRIDYFFLPDGRHVHPLGISRSFVQSCPGIKQYQIVQESLNRITLRIVGSPSFPQSALTDIPAAVKTYLGADVHVDIILLDHMEPEPTGKFRLFVSNVTPPGLS